jgi:hypothetical protein
MADDVRRFLQCRIWLVSDIVGYESVPYWYHSNGNALRMES